MSTPRDPYFIPKTIEGAEGSAKTDAMEAGYEMVIFHSSQG